MTRTHLTAQLARVGKPPPIPAVAERLYRAGAIPSADMWTCARWSEADRRCGPKRRYMA